jgi:plastocyanin
VTLPAPCLRAAAFLAAIALTIAPGGCGGGGNSEKASGSGGAEAVSIEDFAYAPADLTIAEGTTVEFTNGDSTSHTATATDDSFDTGTLEGGKSGSVTLEQPGPFPYYCSFHPFMKGTITVE